MNAVTPLYQNGYGTNSVRTTREIEYDALSRITRMLQHAQTHIDLVSAVYKNNEIWTVLAADLAQPENKLPEQLKAQLASLAIFSIRHGLAVLRKAAQVQPLIDVNSAIMKGLRGEVQE